MTETLYAVTAAFAEESNGERRVSVSGILDKLGVSRSGYHSWLEREPSSQQRRKEQVKERIQEIHQESHKIYGAPKITKKLKDTGERIAEKTVGNYMKELGIKACYVKPYTVTTKDSDFSEELKNILKAEFNQAEPNAVWCSDITYIWTFEGFVYLTSIMDLFSRKIIAWTLSRTLETTHVIETINKAKKSRKIEKPLIFHTDRGCQYVSHDFRKATENMINSYSKKAYPWDNACIESFHALIKREWLNRYKIFDYNHAYKLIFDYIEAFYNTVRIHSYCGYLSPEEYEKEYEYNLNELKKNTG